MTQEDKQLLMKDLCARLRCGVIGRYQWKNNSSYERKLTGTLYDELELSWSSTEDSQFIPYLRPMSSMTEEEWEDWNSKFSMSLGAGANATSFTVYDYVVADFGYSANIYLTEINDMINWLNAHHFDYRNLIEKGLAIAATEEKNPYKE